MLVTLDLGVSLDGYCSDCTRTWATGELDDDLAAIYDLVLRAQEAALDAVRPGPTGREIDAVARDLITAEGHGDHFGHGLGHGVGLEVHEAPRLARSGKRRARGRQRGDRRAGRLRAGSRRGADRGSRRRYHERARRPERNRQGADHRRLSAQGPPAIGRYGRGMTSLARIRPYLRLAAFVAALCALMAPATAGASVHAHAAAKKKKAKPPVVTSVRPMNVEIGQTLEIRGKYFIRGRNKNTVVFKRDGGKAVFVKAKVGTTKLLRVTVPAKLAKEFTKLGTLRRADPLPHPRALQEVRQEVHQAHALAADRPRRPRPRRRATSSPLPDGDCDNDGVKNKADPDDDNDGLTDTVEASLNLNPCTADTDGDGVEDRWEFDCDHNGVLNRDETDDDKDLLTDGHEAGHRHRPLQRRLRRRRRRGRLRVPVRSRPQRRRGPAAQHVPAVPGQAALPEPAVRATPASTTTATR